MKKREIDYVINYGDIFEVNADDDDIAPTGDFVCGFKRNRQIVPDSDKESDIRLALRIAEELMKERMDYFQATNTELEYDDESGDPIEIFDDDFEKMPVNYEVHVRTNTYEGINLLVQRNGECLDKYYKGNIRVENLLDIFEKYTHFEMKAQQDGYFLYHGYKYVISSEVI